MPYMSKWTGPEMRAHYLSGGYRNVQIRDNVNTLARDENGELFDDIEGLTLDALRHAGMSRQDLVIDVGSSYPAFFLGLLKNTYGHNPARLLAMEPHIPVKEELPEYDPEDFAGIQVVRAYGEALPLKPGIARTMTALRSLYHLDEAALDRFFLGARRVLQPNGTLVVWTRSEHYKQHIRDMEDEVRQPLARLMGSAVSGPEAITTGFTSERARERFGNQFRFAWELRQIGKLVVRDLAGLELVMDHHLTLTDMYEDEAGNRPSKEQHRKAIGEVLRKHIRGVFSTPSHAAIVDTFDQSMFFGSNEDQDFPGYVTRLK